MLIEVFAAFVVLEVVVVVLVVVVSAAAAAAATVSSLLFHSLFYAPLPNQLSTIYWDVLYDIWTIIWG